MLFGIYYTAKKKHSVLGIGFKMINPFCVALLLVLITGLYSTDIT
ncbi:hypothetical protein X975_01613, partial [Stegodyphus mimosarum]